MEQATDEAWSRWKINLGDCFRSIFFWKSWVEFLVSHSMIMHDPKKQYVLFRFHKKQVQMLLLQKLFPRCRKGVQEFSGAGWTVDAGNGQPIQG